MAEKPRFRASKVLLSEMQVRVGRRVEVRVESSFVYFEKKGVAMRFWILLAVPMLVLGCRASLDPVAQAPVGAAPATSPKRIFREGENFVLPDGTRVAADEKGGFRLPNGDYVAALADGLLLPNGRRCAPDDAEGFVCP
jgi:hypothetical protein